MDNFSKAYDAIEAVVRATFPEDSGQWSTIVPNDQWGLDEAGWAVVVRRIEAEFNRLISPVAISIPKTAIRNSLGEELNFFQQYLAEKADAAETHVAERVASRLARVAGRKLATHRAEEA